MMNHTHRAPQRPIGRYLGGKWKLAPWIISNFPSHKIYVEPFGGAASVLLRKPRVPNEIYNDLDQNIVNIFRVLQDKKLSEELIQKCYLTPFARSEYEQSFEKSGDLVEQARRFIIRSFFGYGSKACLDKLSKTAFRSYRKGDASPAVDWMNYPQHLPALIERFRGVVVENVTASEVIKRYDSPNTLFYLDPPYVHSTRGSTGKYC